MYRRFLFGLAFVLSALGMPQGVAAQMLTGFDEEPSDQRPQEDSLDLPVSRGPTSNAPHRLSVDERVLEPVQLRMPDRFVDTQAEDVPYIQTSDVAPTRVFAPLTAPDTENVAPPRTQVNDAYLNVKPLTSETLANTQPVGAEGDGGDAPVDLIADDLRHEDAENVVVASGNVMLEQGGRIMRADEIRYYVDEDRVVASGNVVLNEESGDIYLADDVEFTDGLKDGFVQGLKAYLADGSRLIASGGERVNGNETIARSARYTPCEPCKNDPEKSPVWQIRAAEVNHNKEEARVSYRHARFELYGVPVLYTPYFSHADGTVEQKSGFVSPSLGFDSVLGTSVGLNYYWAIAEDMDATMGLTYFSDENPMVTGEFRKSWDNASLLVDAGTTYSSRVDSTGGQTFQTDDEWRGHFFAEGLWDINNKWRAGLDVEHVSDDQYLRQYDFSSEDVLESQIYLERFSGRNYAVGRVLKFQDVRIREEQEDQPEVLPEIIAGFIGDPNSVPIIGGRWDLEASFLGLRRDGKERDMNRLSVDAGWERRLVSDAGLVFDLDGSIRADAYNVRDRDGTALNLGKDGDASESRVFPQFHMEASYPLVKPMEKMQILIEPRAALTFAPNIDLNDDIPNEDSQDVQIDASNLFEPNRFPGLDRVEDRNRVTYGLRTGFYGYDGSHFSVFTGQSRRLENKGTPFPEGSGLNGQESDYVGEISGSYKSDHRLNYRFQLDATSLESERHEFYAVSDLGRVSLSGQYLYAKGLENTGLDGDREQIGADLGYYLTENWRTNFGAVQDLGEESGLRYAYAGLEHFGQCVSWSFTAERSLTDDSSGDSDTEFMFRIGLKNLGEFKESGWSAKSKYDYDD